MIIITSILLNAFENSKPFFSDTNLLFLLWAIDLLYSKLMGNSYHIKTFQKTNFANSSIVLNLELR